MGMEKKCPYIKRDDVAQMLIEGVLEDNSSPQYAEYIRLLVYSVPSADVVPIRHGHWEVIDAEEPRRYGCSLCKRLSWHIENYCPNCGAKMDGE